MARGVSLAPPTKGAQGEKESIAHRLGVQIPCSLGAQEKKKDSIRAPEKGDWQYTAQAMRV